MLWRNCHPVAVGARPTVHEDDGYALTFTKNRVCDPGSVGHRQVAVLWKDGLIVCLGAAHAVHEATVGAIPAAANRR